MAPIILVIVALLFANPPTLTTARSRSRSRSRITVVGAVYCDTCSSNAFTKHSYFLPGVDVQIRCKFKENSQRSTEQVNYSVNTTTDRYGVYKLEIPSVVDGLNCVHGLAVVSMCQATLLAAPPTSSCAVPSVRSASNAISIKSDQDNLCIYSLNALSYKPSRKNATLCGDNRDELAGALEASKCFFPWPNLPSIFPFPPLSSLPFPFNLPFPFSNLPPFPPTALFSPPPPAPPPFSLWDPRTWIPYSPPSPHDKSP